MERAIRNFANIAAFQWFLKERGVRRLVGPTGYKKAAVLFLMRERANGELEVLLTRRSNTVTSHKGENCLPGGKFDPTKDKNLIDTALREAEEEVGLARQRVLTIALMPPTPSGWTEFLAVSTLVGILTADVQLTQNKDEVADVFWVPIRVFVSNEHHVPVVGRWWNAITLSDSFDFVDSTLERRDIWGLTARICVAASAIALDRFPDFPHTTSFISDKEGRALFLMQIALTQEDFFHHDRDNVSINAKL